jgi:hypothetical protein
MSRSQPFRQANASGAVGYAGFLVEAGLSLWRGDIVIRAKDENLPMYGQG